MLRIMLAVAALLAVAAPFTTAPAGAQPGPPALQQAARQCQRVLPAARRFVGRPAAVARARFRAPPGVIVRLCAVCTHDYRPNRLTFALDRAQIVRSVSCV